MTLHEENCLILDIFLGIFIKQKKDNYIFFYVKETVSCISASLKRQYQTSAAKKHLVWAHMWASADRVSTKVTFLLSTKSNFRRNVILISSKIRCFYFPSISILTSEFRSWYQISISMSKFQSIFHLNKFWFWQFFSSLKVTLLGTLRPFLSFTVP
jgi:hypothetical protein